MFHHVSSCFIMFHHVSSCFIMFHHVSSCFIMFHHVSSCFIHITDSPENGQADQTRGAGHVSCGYQIAQAALASYQQGLQLFIDVFLCPVNTHWLLTTVLRYQVRTEFFRCTVFFSFVLSKHSKRNGVLAFVWVSLNPWGNIHHDIPWHPQRWIEHESTCAPQTGPVLCNTLLPLYACQGLWLQPSLETGNLQEGMKRMLSKMSKGLKSRAIELIWTAYDSIQ